MFHAKIGTGKILILFYKTHRKLHLRKDSIIRCQVRNRKKAQNT